MMMINFLVSTKVSLFLILSFILTVLVCSIPIHNNGNCYPNCEKQNQQQQQYEQQQQQCYEQWSKAPPESSIVTPQSSLSSSMQISRGGGLDHNITSDNINAPTEGEKENENENEKEQEYLEKEEEIDYESIALALRMSCELNRQLMCGTDGLTCAGGHTEQVHHLDFPQESQTWFHSIQPPSPPHSQTATAANIISSDSQASSSLASSSSSAAAVTTASLEPLTIFHAKCPRTLSSFKKGRRHSLRIKTGCARWGPTLSLYLRQLHTTLECPPITFALALIYLDRACSAETQRSTITEPSATGSFSSSAGFMTTAACPHLTPRTVHRLVLTAMVIASKAMDASHATTTATTTTTKTPGKVGGGTLQDKYTNLIRTFGVSESALSHMETWMLEALGDQGTWVNMEHLKNLWNMWECAFPSDTINVGIGLRKYIEQATNQQQQPHYHETPYVIGAQHQQKQQWNNGSNDSDATGTYVHIRREQHVIHVQRPTHLYHESGQQIYHHQQQHKVQEHQQKLWTSQSKYDSQYSHSNSYQNHVGNDGYHSEQRQWQNQQPQQQQQQQQQHQYGNDESDLDLFLRASS